MNLSGNDKNKITGKKYQPVMSITGLNDQGHSLVLFKEMDPNSYICKQTSVAQGKTPAEHNIWDLNEETKC